MGSLFTSSNSSLQGVPHFQSSGSFIGFVLIRTSRIQLLLQLIPFDCGAAHVDSLFTNSNSNLQGSYSDNYHFMEFILCVEDQDGQLDHTSSFWARLSWAHHCDGLGRAKFF